jgi:hypothetical protein
LIGQYTTTQEGRRYLIINRCREIDRIINKNWEAIVKLVDSKFDSEEEKNQWGARSIQCERKEIGVTSEQITDVDGSLKIKTRKRVLEDYRGKIQY